MHLFAPDYRKYWIATDIYILGFPLLFLGVIAIGLWISVRLKRQLTAGRQE